jgi:hypothetical protein
VPEALFYEADMSAFELNRQFDVVMCLFSSIGYLCTQDRVTAALHCFRRHVGLGGVIIVEPWFAPGVLREGTSSTKAGETDTMRVERTSHLTIDGRLSKLVFNYRIEDATGVRVFQELHELGLFTPPEMLASFEAAGLAVTYDPAGLTDRGLYIARVSA